MKNKIRFLLLVLLLICWSLTFFVGYFYVHDLPNNIVTYTIVSNSNISNRQFNGITNSMNVRANALRNSEANFNMLLVFISVAAVVVFAGYPKTAVVTVVFISALVGIVIGRWVVPMPSGVLRPIRTEMSGLQYRHQNTDHTFQISLLRSSHSNEISVNVVDSYNQVVETLFFDFRYGIVLSKIYNSVNEVAPDAPTLEKVEPGFSLRPQQKHLISNQSSLG